LDTKITNIIRNKDKTFISKNNEISNISDYFRESEVETDTLVNFQKNRLENKININVPIDNDINTYQIKSNDDSYFLTETGLNIMKRFIFGKVSDTTLNINMSINNKIFSDHFKNKVHIFVNGKFLTNDEFYISNSNIVSTVPANSYIEIYINQYDSISYSFVLASEKSSFNESELSYLLYNNGFL